MNLQVGVKALIKNRSGQYLFLRRRMKVSTDSEETSWDIPGGRIQPDEALLDALRREIEEEVGYAITNAPTLIAAQDIFVRDKDFHVVRLTYAVEADIPAVHLSDEHDEYVWVEGVKVKSIRVEPYLAEVLSSLKVS